MANRRALQWVVTFGARIVAATTARSFAALIRRGRPDRARAQPCQSVFAVAAAPYVDGIDRHAQPAGLMNATNAGLLVNPNTTASGPARSCQEFMLDCGSNNLNFVQSRPGRF